MGLNPTKANHLERGSWGETLAREHLLANGYVFLVQNLRLGKSEIDLVLLQDATVVWAEVKTRTAEVADPQELLTKRKWEVMQEAADQWMNQHYPNHNLRFDLIVITGTEEHHILTHYPGAFSPD